MKKALSFILSVILLFSCFALSVSAAETSKDFRYENRFNAALLAFNDLSLISEDYYAIPGLENTALGGEKNCTAMTPQGLCVSDEFIFISAYCGIKRYKTDLEENINFGKNKDKLAAEENHEVHNSVIYILDRETGAYLKTLVLPDANHVGGLATDGKNLFIAKSNDKQVSVISASQITLAMQTKSFTVKAVYEYSFDCGCTASFVTYHNDILWVGVFDEKAEGELNGYEIDLFGLEKVASVKIPAKANGAAFYDFEGETCLVVGSSYGRKNLSKAHLYTVDSYGTENMLLKKKDDYTLPPTVQNFAFYGDRVYHIYESAATCYSQVESLFETKSTSFPVDRVCIGQADNLFNWHNENFFLARISAFVRAVKTVVENIF
ncbi:MAG: hypothetical protein IJB74_00925 [Clostridia bacterium]|nr:hypothetical protein [Clostridia bacterium]